MKVLIEEREPFMDWWIIGEADYVEETKDRIKVIRNGRCDWYQKEGFYERCRKIF